MSASGLTARSTLVFNAFVSTSCPKDRKGEGVRDGRGSALLVPRLPCGSAVGAEGAGRCRRPPCPRPGIFRDSRDRVYGWVNRHRRQGGKLINRSQRTRRELADSEVITVLTTAARRSDVSDAEVEKAERGDVVVLCHEDLHELWTAAQAGKGSTEVVRRLRQDLASAKLRRAEGRVG